MEDFSNLSDDDLELEIQKEEQAERRRRRVDEDYRRSLPLEERTDEDINDEIEGIENAQAFQNGDISEADYLAREKDRDSRWREYQLAQMDDDDRALVRRHWRARDAQTRKTPVIMPDGLEMDSAQFNTRLSPDEEDSFQEWKKKYAPRDSGADYDLRGAFKEGLRPDPKNGHWSDKFKKPNHPTFSTESQYARGEWRKYAGSWNNGQFMPSAYSRNNTMDESRRAELQRGLESRTAKGGWSDFADSIRFEDEDMQRSKIEQYLRDNPKEKKEDMGAEVERRMRWIRQENEAIDTDEEAAEEAGLIGRKYNEQEAQEPKFEAKDGKFYEKSNPERYINLSGHGYFNVEREDGKFDTYSVDDLLKDGTIVLSPITGDSGVKNEGADGPIGNKNTLILPQRIFDSLREQGKMKTRRDIFTQSAIDLQAEGRGGIGGDTPDRSRAAALRMTPFAGGLAADGSLREMQALTKLHEADYGTLEEAENLLRKSGIDIEKYADLPSFDEKGNDYRREVSKLAEEEILRRTKNREWASKEQQYSYKTTSDSILGGLLDSSGYMFEYMVPGAALGKLGKGATLAQRALRGAKMGLAPAARSAVSRYEKLNTADYATTKDGTLVKTFDAEDNVLKPAVGAGVEAAVEIGTDAALDATLGLLGRGAGIAARAFKDTPFLGGIIRGIGKMSNGSKAVAQKYAQKFAATRAGRIAMKTGMALGELRQATGFTANGLTEGLEEIVQQFADDALGLDKKSAEYKGFAKEWQDFENSTLSREGLTDIWLGLLGQMVVQGAIGGGAAAMSYASKDAQAARRNLRGALQAAGIDDATINSLTPKQQDYLARAFQHFSANPDKLEKALRRAGWQLGEVGRKLVNQKGFRFTTELQDRGVAPESFNARFKKDADGNDTDEWDFQPDLSGRNAMRDDVHGVTVVKNADGSITVSNDLRGDSHTILDGDMDAVRNAADAEVRQNQAMALDNEEKFQYLQGLRDKMFKGKNILVFDTEQSLKNAMAAGLREKGEYLGLRSMDAVFGADGHLGRAGRTGRAPGGFHLADVGDGISAIVLVLDNIESPADMARVLRHESGHGQSVKDKSALDVGFLSDSDPDSEFMQYRKKILASLMEERGMTKAEASKILNSSDGWTESFANWVQSRAHKPTWSQKREHAKREERRARGENLPKNDADWEAWIAEAEAANNTGDGVLNKVDFIPVDETERRDDETRDGTDETPEQPAEETGEPERGEAEESMEESAPQSEAPDAGVVEPSGTDNGGQNLTEPERPVPVNSIGGDAESTAPKTHRQELLDAAEPPAESAGALPSAGTGNKTFTAENAAEAKKSAKRGHNLRGFSYEDYGELPNNDPDTMDSEPGGTGDAFGAALLRFAKDNDGILYLPSSNADPLYDWIQSFLDGNARKNNRGEFIALFGMNPRKGRNDNITEDFPEDLKPIIEGNIERKGIEALPEMLLAARKSYSEWVAQKRKSQSKMRERMANAREIGGDMYYLDELEARDEADAEYDNAYAEVEKYGSGTPEIRNFSRAEMRKLERGDIIRFDHAESRWEVVDYDAAGDVLTVAKPGTVDNPFFTGEEARQAEKADYAKFRISPDGIEEIVPETGENGNGRENQGRTAETVAGDAQGAQGGKRGRKPAEAGTFTLESATAAEIAAENRRRAEQAEIKRRQEEQPRGKGTLAETGQTLLDLGGAEDEDLFNRTARPQKPPEVDFNSSPVYVIGGNGEIQEGKITGVAKGGRTKVKYGDHEELLPQSKVFTTRELAEKAIAERQRQAEVVKDIKTNEKPPASAPQKTGATTPPKAAKPAEGGKSASGGAPKSSAPTVSRTTAKPAFKRGDRVFIKGAKDGQRVTFLKANADGTADVQVRTPGANRYAPEEVETRTVPMGDVSSTGMKDTLTDAERNAYRRGVEEQTREAMRNDPALQRIDTAYRAAKTDAERNTLKAQFAERVRALQKTPSGRQKQAGIAYPDASPEIRVLFDTPVFGKKSREDFGRILAKHRPDLDANAVIDEIAKFNTQKKRKAALHWVVRGAIRLPEDAYKVEDALSVAEKAKVDPFAYKSPLELIEAHKDIKPTRRATDPATVPELSDRRDEGDGIVSYEVADTREGQASMRRIIDTHWGEDANPWCLLARQGSGYTDERITNFQNRIRENGSHAEYGLPPWPGYNAPYAERERWNDLASGKYKQTHKPEYLETAWYYWQHYSALPKRVAFKNGRLLAFMATERLDLDNWSDYQRFQDRLEGRYPERVKEYKSWTETEEAIENGVPEFLEWMKVNYGDEFDRAWGTSGVAEEWWDRTDTSHPDLDWARGNAQVNFDTPGIYTGSAADYANRSRQGGVDDGPSLKKVGTGEGSQVYGWGLYGSTVRGVAEGYARGDVFAKKNPRRAGHFEINGKRLPEWVSDRILEFDEFGSTYFDGRKPDAEFLIEALKDKGVTYGHEDAGRILKQVEEDRDGLRFVSETDGNLYEQTFFTNRAPGDESHLLKWYEPVSEETWDIIREAERANGTLYNDNGTMLGLNQGYVLERDGKPVYPKVTGQSLYETLAKELGSPKAASEFLARAGIDGVKYPMDSYGKTVKDGDKAGWNYVSFRDDNIRVDHKWEDGVMQFDTPELSPVTPEQDAAYMDAVRRGDMDTAARMVRPLFEKYAESHKISLDEASALFAKIAKATYDKTTYFEVYGIRGDRRLLVPDDAFPNSHSLYQDSDRVEPEDWDDEGNPIFKMYEFAPEYYDGGELPGTSTIGLDESDFDNEDRLAEKIKKALEQEYAHENEYVYLVGGDSAGWGEDAGERLISDAEVLSVLCVVSSENEGTYSNPKMRIVYTNKSAEPVTYDDAGNVIPLSQRFNPQNDDIRFDTPELSPVTPEQDAAYMDAVKHGDTETAAKMVEGRLKEQGFSAPVSIAVHAEDAVDGQRQYSLRTMPTELAQEIAKWKTRSKSPYSNSYYNATDITWDHKPDRSLRVSDHWNFWSRGQEHCVTDRPVENGAKWVLAEYHAEDGKYHVLKEYDAVDGNRTTRQLEQASDAYYKKAIRSLIGQEVSGAGFKSGILKGVEQRADGGEDAVIEVRPSGKTIREFAPNVVRATNMDSRDPWRGAKLKKGAADYKVALNPTTGDVKSAEPVTYDDAGNVIPLSQRFNPQREDIRFDTPELDPDAERAYREWLGKYRLKDTPDRRKEWESKRPSARRQETGGRTGGESLFDGYLDELLGIAGATPKNPLGQVVPPPDGSVAQSIDAEIAADEARAARGAARAQGAPPAPAPGSQGNERLDPGYEPESLGAGVKDPVSRQEIVDKFRELFSDTVAIRGKNTTRIGKYAGHYEPDAGIIRSKDPVSLRTIPHELGHHIDAVLKKRGPMRPNAVKAELIALGKKLYGGKQPAGGYQSEGFAEMVKYYLQGNEEGLKKEAPAVYSWLVNDFSKAHPDIMEKMDALRDMIDRFQNQSGDEAVRAIRAKDPNLAERIVSRLADMIKGLKLTQENWIDTGAFITKGMRASGLDKLMDWRAALKRGDVAEMNDIIENHPVLKWKLYNGKSAARAYQALAGGLTDLSGTRRYTYGDLGMATPGHAADEKLPTFKEIFSGFTPEEMDEFENYAIARIAKEAYLDKGLEFGLTKSEIAPTLAKHARNTKFRDALERYTHYKHGVLHLLVDAGAMSQEQFEEIVKANPIYVKIARRRESADLFRDRMLKKRGKAVNRRTGSGRQVEDIFDAGLVDDERVFSAAFQADLLRSLVNLGKRGEVNNAAPGGALQGELSVGANWIHEVPNAQGAVRFTAEQLRKQITDAMRGAAMAPDKAAADNLFDQLFSDGKDILTVFKQKPSEGKNGLVSLYDEDGALHTYELPENNAEGWAKGLMGFTDSKKPNILEQWAQIAAAATRTGATILNPTFALRNIVRDTLHASTVNEFGFMIPGASTVQGIAMDMMGSNAKEIFDAMGIPMGSMLGESRLQSARRANRYLMSRNWFEAQWNKGVKKAIADFVGFSENGTRIKEFKLVRDYMLSHGASEKAADMLAGANALDITIDFQRGGEVAKSVNRFIPFFNAGIQGLEQTARAFGLLRAKEWQLETDRKRRAGRTVLQGAAWLLMLSLLAELFNRSDEDRKRKIDELKPHERWNYISFGDVRLPVPYEIGYIFSSIPRAVIAELYDGQKGAVAECLGMFRQTLPGISPTDIAFVGPALNTVMNEYWHGGTIIPEYIQKSKLSYDWYDERTSEFSKMLGKAMYKVFGHGKISSPAHIDAFMNGITGNMYGRTLGAIGGQAELDASRPNTWPVVGTFFRNNLTANRLVGEFYERKIELEREKGSGVATDEELAELQNAEKLAKRFAELRKESKKAKEDKSLSVTERNDKLEKIVLKMQQGVRDYNKNPSGGKRDGVRARGR